MPLCLLTAAACAAAVLVMAVPASAHHGATVSATATSLTLDPSKCGMYERRPVSRCDGYRRATVTWSATCGARAFVSVEYLATRKGGGRPIRLAFEDLPEGQLGGTTTTLVQPGAHLYAVVRVDCFWPDSEGTGPEEHTVTVTSAPTAPVTVAPWLTGVSTQAANFCNFNPGSRTILQAGRRGNIISFSTDYVEKSLLGAGRRTAAGVRQRRLVARGPGLRLRRRPEVFLLQEFGRREPFQGLLRVNTRRPGWIKFWEEVGGVRSNTLAIRAVPNRC
jgi:hypothetical protein